MPSFPSGPGKPAASSSDRPLRLASLLAALLSLFLPLPPGAPALAAPTVRVILDNSYPPFAFLDSSGRLQGIAPDLWRLWERRTGGRAELIPLDWGKALEAMAAGRGDVIDTLFETEARKRFLVFSRPYARVETLAFYSDRIAGIGNASTLRDFPVAVARGDDVGRILRENGVGRILEYENYEETVRAAVEGKVGIFCMARQSGLYYLYKLGAADRFRASPPIHAGGMHRAYPKGREALMRAVEAGFEAIPPEEIRAIERKWVGAPLWDPASLRAFLLGIGGALTAAGALLLWNGLLRRRVREKTGELATLLGEVQEARRRMATLLDNLPGVAYRCRNDRDWTMEFISEGCRELTGYAPEDFLSNRITFNQVILPDHREALWEEWERNLPSRRPFHSEYPIRTASGETRWVLERGCGVYAEDGTVSALEGLILDVTEKRAAEAKLAALNADLERRVAERTEDLARANEELKRSLDLLTATQSELVRSEKMAALGRLVAGVAHEINTPVGVSVTAASFLGQETGELRRSLSEGRLTRSALEGFLSSAERSAEILLANLNRAAELIRSFKQVAVDRSAGQERTFEVGAYLEEILLGLQPLFKRTPFVVRADHPDRVFVRADPGALSQIVTNLVSNALTHAFEGREAGSVELRVSSGGARGEEAVLTCRDDGRGIPAEAMPRLFEPFFTTRPGTGGSGLGLHIVYNLVTRTLGGTIECSSRPDEGTTFTIRFPRGLAADPPERTA